MERDEIEELRAEVEALSHLVATLAHAVAENDAVASYMRFTGLKRRSDLDEGVMRRLDALACQMAVLMYEAERARSSRAVLATRPVDALRDRMAALREASTAERGWRTRHDGLAEIIPFPRAPRGSDDGHEG